MPLKMYSEGDISLPSIKNIIAIAAGKGGVGKSTVTVNLALALSRLGYAVGVMDADIYGPSIRKMLPEDKPPTQQGQLINPALCGNIKMISMAYFRKDSEASVVRAPIANGIISQFIKTVLWGNLDFLLIDFPPGTGDIQLTLSQQAQLTGAIMVTTPQEVAVMDVRKAINLFDQTHIPILGIVENMSYYQEQSSGNKIYLFGKGGGERLAKESGVPCLGAIPLDAALSECGDSGKSIFDQQNSISQHFLTLAQALCHQIDSTKSVASESMNSFEIIWKEMS